jgi:UDP-N-acetylglucosamine--N-acetylmuramyl-(pentapeptide) pyrophosphoryl-undecaprenol N-acetylglucosamine transferase
MPVNNKKTIIVTGGGTGGHAFPALEIINEIKRREQNINVIWVGNSNSLEEKIASVNKINFVPLKVKKILGQTKFKKILALAALIKAVFICFGYFSKTRPKAVIGVGGYVSAPILLVAFLFNVKRYVAEQNVRPGLANKYLGKLATRVFINFEDSKAYFPSKKTILTGNPVRKEFFAIKRVPKTSFNILITGGSLGAYFLNSNIPKVIKEINKECPDIFITHQTGGDMVEEVTAAYKTIDINASVVGFINDMPKAFGNSDLVISRAGATVISEIMASGTPSILIPYPYALGHQKDNAMVLVDHNAALMVMEGAGFVGSLALAIKKLYSDKNLLFNMSTKAKNLALPNASQKIVDIILEDLN